MKKPKKQKKFKIKTGLLKKKKTINFFGSLLNRYKKQPKNFKPTNFFRKFVYVFSFVFLVLCILFFSHVDYKKNNENIKSISFQTTDLEFKRKIEPLVYKELNNNIKLKQPPALFFNNLTKVLDGSDLIDEYSIRTYLDNRMDLNIKTQKPIMVIYSKEGQSFLVGSSYKIVVKNPSVDEKTDLPEVYLPEIKIDWRSKTYNQNKNNITRTVLNYGWLYSETKNIYDGLKLSGIEAKASSVEVSWRASSGFSLNFTNFDGSRVHVDIGHKKIKKKMSNLSIVINNLKNRNMSVKTIDLDSVEMATFTL